MFWTIIGIIASVSVTSGFIPQIIRGIRTKRLDDVSPGMYMFIIFGMCMWIFYGIHLKDKIIIGANITGLVFSATVLFLRYMYRLKQPEKNFPPL